MPIRPPCVLPLRALACALSCSVFLPQLAPAQPALRRGAPGRIVSAQYVEEATIRDSEEGTPDRFRCTVAHQPPGKMRFECSAADGTYLVVSDGQHTWKYDSSLNQYTEESGSRLLPDPGADVGTTKVIRKPDQTIQIDGVKHPCWVAEARVDGTGHSSVSMTYTSFVDQKLDYEIRGILSMRFKHPDGPASTVDEEFVRKNVTLGAPIDASVFHFEPPAGARRVDKIERPLPSVLPQDPLPAEFIGREAPPLVARGLDGASYRVSDFKGKPVLLDFWATWCLPCRESRPVVESLYREYKDRGLVVLAVSDESPETVVAFLKGSAFPYPVILSDASAFLQPYGVAYLPTFVLIGRDGKIAGYQAGFPGERALRDLARRLMDAAGR